MSTEEDLAIPGNGVMQQQTEADKLLNGIAVKLKDCRSFSGKLQRAVTALHIYVARVNQMRLEEFSNALSARGLGSPWHCPHWWTFASVCQAMRCAGVNELIEVEVDGLNVRLIGAGVPDKPLDPGINA